MRRWGSVCYSVGAVLSALVGVLHFFAPRAFGWYTYIPDAPVEVVVSMDYINFLFSLLLSGLSILLLLLKGRLFGGSTELLAFYGLLVATWLGRTAVSVAIPWPNALQTWLVLGSATELVLLLIPLPHLWAVRRPSRQFVS